MPYDLKVNSEVKSNFDVIQKDIDEIEDTIMKTYQAMLELDDSVWKAKEKEKIDQEFMPYLKKFAEKYPSYLKKRLTFAREAIEKHEELDTERAKLSDIEVL